MNTAENVSGLVEEYRVLLEGMDADSSEAIQKTLIRDAGWTPEAASHLLGLARAYGSFMLRNALAISAALGIEDGELGF
jgi:hypothetical protein